MPGGPGKIDEYNKSLTPEQRKANARRAARRPRKKTKTIREFAKLINEAPALKEAVGVLQSLGLNDKEATNAAAIAAAVFRAAIEGDMKAVEKWERYIGQTDATAESGNGVIMDLIADLRKDDG